LGKRTAGWAGSRASLAEVGQIPAAALDDVAGHARLVGVDRAGRGGQVAGHGGAQALHVVEQPGDLRGVLVVMGYRNGSGTS
jgi:hypothetical protein